MQEDLWGEKTTQQNPKRTKPKPPPVTLTTNDCVFFGHAFQIIGLNGEKKCSICGEKGFCPVCSPIAPPHANPYYCTKHTPLEGNVQA